MYWGPISYYGSVFGKQRVHVAEKTEFSLRVLHFHIFFFSTISLIIYLNYQGWELKLKKPMGTLLLGTGIISFCLSWARSWIREWEPGDNESGIFVSQWEMLQANKPWELGIIKEGIALKQNLPQLLDSLYLFSHKTLGVLRSTLAPAAP